MIWFGYPRKLQNFLNPECDVGLVPLFRCMNYNSFCKLNLQNWSMGQALGCLQVDQSNIVIREHFGKFDDVLEPGCHCLPWCLGYRVAGGLSLRVQQLDVRCETKTKVFNFYTCTFLKWCDLNLMYILVWLCILFNFLLKLKFYLPYGNVDVLRYEMGSSSFGSNLTIVS